VAQFLAYPVEVYRKLFYFSCLNCYHVVIDFLINKNKTIDSENSKCDYIDIGYLCNTYQSTLDLLELGLLFYNSMFFLKTETTLF